MSTSLRAMCVVCWALLLSIIAGCSSEDAPPPVATSNTTAFSVLITSEDPTPASLSETGSQGASTLPTKASDTATTAAPFGSVEASGLAAALTAGDTAALGSAVVLPSAVNLSADVLASLESMGPIVFDVASFQDNGDGTATVNAKVGGTPWVANLLLVNGRWMLVTTEQSR